SPMWNAFRHGLRDLGYLEGGNIAFDYEYGDGVSERLAEAAAALVRRPVDVIATFGTPASLAAKQATTAILRREPARLVPARRRLRAQDFARHQARRAAGGAGDEVRSRGQLEDRQGARPRADADVHRPRRRGDRMSSRREFITLLGGAAFAWPQAASAQRPSGMRRIGVLMRVEEDDPEGKAQLSGFMRELAGLGWADGRNLRM